MRNTLHLCVVLSLLGVLGGRLFALADLDVREDARLLGGVEAVVHRLLHRREEGLRGVVEAEEVAVLAEELGDGDLALAPGELLGGDAATRGGLGPLAAPLRNEGFPAAGRGRRGPECKCTLSHRLLTVLPLRYLRRGQTGWYFCRCLSREEDTRSAAQTHSSAHIL